MSSILFTRRRRSATPIVGWATLIVVGSCAPPAPVVAEANLVPAAGAIRQARLAQNFAIARNDIDNISRYWTEDVTVRRGLGQSVRGREAYRQLFESAGQGGNRVIYQREPVTIETSTQWPLAYEEGNWTGNQGSVTGPAIIGGRYSAQWVKRDGQWLIRAEVFVALWCAREGCSSTLLP